MAEENSQKCLMCGETMNVTRGFYKSYSPLFANNIDQRMCWCKNCIAKLFKENQEEYQDDEKALYETCKQVDTYFDKKTYDSYLSRSGDKKEIDLCGYYFTQINSLKHNKGKTFMSHNRHKEIVVGIAENNINNTTSEINVDTEKAQKDVKRLLGYDPFVGYSEEDKQYLYASLLSFLNEDTLGDGIKLSAYIQIVNNNNQIRKTDLTLNSLYSDIKSMITNAKDIDILQGAKSKVVTSNDKIMKENSISVKNRGDKKSGASTLTYMMKDLRELDFEDAEEDYYDQKKAYGMKLVADISNKSIFEQLQFDENDYTDIIKMQREKVQECEKKIDDLNEENRQLYLEVDKLKSIITNR